MTQIARGPAPSEREAAAAIEKAATTDAAVRIETSACPPREWAPKTTTWASHCWSVHVLPRP